MPPTVICAPSVSGPHASAVAGRADMKKPLTSSAVKAKSSRSRFMYPAQLVNPSSTSMMGSSCNKCQEFFAKGTNDRPANVSGGFER